MHTKIIAVLIGGILLLSGCKQGADNTKNQPQQMVTESQAFITNVEKAHHKADFMSHKYVAFG